MTSAPTRIDLAGGTIDIWPLYLFHPGAQTLNAAISVRATARLESRDDGRIAIRSEDTGVSLEADDWRELWDRKELRLLSFLVHFEARHHADHLVAVPGWRRHCRVVGAQRRAALAREAHALRSRGLLQVAMNVEARAINVPTGLQDYRPALYGGIAAVELEADGVKRVPLNVDLAELQKRIVLCYTGEPQRNSGTNNWEITSVTSTATGHLRLLRTHPRHRCRHARGARARRLGCGRPRDCAGWENRKQLAPGVTTPAIDDLIARATAAGATAAKVCGAGGGMHVQLRASSSARPIAAALAGGGARLLDYTFDATGCRVDNNPSR